MYGRGLILRGLDAKTRIADGREQMSLTTLIHGSPGIARGTVAIVFAQAQAKRGALPIFVMIARRFIVARQPRSDNVAIDRQAVTAMSELLRQCYSCRRRSPC